EPMTKPPPVTRSSAARPVSTRAALSVSPESGTSSAGRPPATAGFGPAPTPESTISSTMVFQSPQLSQRPTLRAVTAPQDWQTKEDFVRAMWCPQLALKITERPPGIKNEK